MLGKFIKYLNNIKLKKQKSKIHYLKLLFEVDFLDGIFNWIVKNRNIIS